MNESLEELASLYVLDQLAGDERAAFEARLVREPEIAALVRNLEAALARGVRALPPREPPASLLGRIEAEIDSRPADAAPAPGKVEGPALSKAEGPAPVSGRSPASGRAVPSQRAAWATFARWGLAAVIAVSLATLALQSLRRSPAEPKIVFVGLDADRNTYAELSLRGPGKDPDTRFIQLAALAEKLWEKPGELPARPVPSAGASHGYALFDPGSQQGFIAIERLPAIAENQHYHLWLVEPAAGSIRDGGVLPLAGLQRGLYSFALGSAHDEESGRPNIFVTVEDDGADTPTGQPRGKVVLGRRPI